jgi:hypothetical protein
LDEENFLRVRSRISANSALDRTAQGLDFAAALHLARADDHGDSVTFDRQLIRAPRAPGLGNVRAP